MNDTHEYVMPFHSMEQSLEQLLKEVKQVVTHNTPRHLQLLLSKDGIARTVSFNMVMPIQYPDELLASPGTTSGNWTVISREEWEQKLNELTWGGFSIEIRTQLVNGVLSHFPESDLLSFIDVGEHSGVLMITSGIILLSLIEEETTVQ